MARLVYASRFEIPAGEGLNPASSEYGAWITDWYQDRMHLSKFAFEPGRTEAVANLPAAHSLSSRLYADENGSACHIQWEHPSQSFDGLRWTNDIRIGRFGERCVIEHQILVESVDYTVAPVRLLFGSPRVVRDICAKTTAYVGDMQLRASPYPLRQGGLSEFLTLLESRQRKLPIVFYHHMRRVIRT